MKVRGDWLEAEGTQAVCGMLTGGGAQALLVGGCVRNALLGAPVRDVDIATDALPQRVIELAGEAGLKAVPTGIEHGTVTVVADGRGFEVTTFRRDVETFGRHARVAFSNRVEEDASRRDFTMNALYARPDGAVIDPLGGLADLTARRVRFIGDAGARIREDYLRSLRFFRFHAWYGDPEGGLDPDALDAIARNLDGLETLSRERVGAELLKLLGAPDPAPALAGMARAGALAALVPGADPVALAPLVEIEAQGGLQLEALRRLAAIGGPEVWDSLRLSRAQIGRLHRLRKAASGAAGAAELGYDLGSEAACDALALRAALTGDRWSEDAAAAARHGAQQRFPLRAADLMPAYRGPALGRRLAELERAWIASGFRLGRGDLLDLK